MALASTGFKGLDKIICDLKLGDNVVLQVDNIDDYIHFVKPYVKTALLHGRKVVYMRFANHKPVLENNPAVNVYHLDAKGGFESFSSQVHSIISQEGVKTYYVFDCLSDLLNAWATDLMVGNFFKVTCPYLFELDTIAYFAIFRNYHSFQTIARIRETTQLLLDIYKFDDNMYVHPLKVWARYSPTMFLPHLQKGDDFDPVVSSYDASQLLSHISTENVSARYLDYWDRLFMKSDSLMGHPSDSKQVKDHIQEICRVMIGKEKRITDLAQQHFSLADLINIKNRLIGSGYIGGKAVGMLLAQKILSNDLSFEWGKYLELHDSFFIGSDVFYSYIVENGWWKLHMQQKTKEGYFKLAPEIHENLLKGKFPDQIRERFREIIEYFGQSPIIIRSSSLLEDSFGNAFAGKYESFFLVNQGNPEERYFEFEQAVRKVFASTMNEDALTYRLQRGLDQQDEQMALLVQRVSGSYKKSYFFPDLAGVGVSYNTFVWNPDLDPKAGLLRLVFGLGTRAVDRVEDDYPQIIALDQPLLRPYADKEDQTRFSQHSADLLDTKDNSWKTIDVSQLLNDKPNLKPELIADRDFATENRLKEMGRKPQPLWLVTFKNLLSNTNYAEVMQKMLKTLERHYKYPVDIEFTVNFVNDNNFRVNLVQCRPLQTKGIRANAKVPENIDDKRILFASHGFTMGGSISQPIKSVIYVNPQKYLDLPNSEKYSIARLVGKINKEIPDRQTTPTLLMGPGRWGTSTPSLGVPVNFSEINKVAVLAEISHESANIMPELSFGTHFFQDLVETDIFYIALFPGKEKVVFNESLFQKFPNQIKTVLPDENKYNDIVSLYEFENGQLQVICDIISQKIVCFLN